MAAAHERERTCGPLALFACRPPAGRGPAKAEAVRASFAGPVTPEVPASVLQLHPNVTVFCDEEAAKLL